MSENQNDSINFLIKKIKSFGNAAAIITNKTEFSYADLLANYEKAKSNLAETAVPNNSVVAVRGEFSPVTIGLMLALIEKNCIYVPIATAVKTVPKFLEIAEVQYFFDCAANCQADCQKAEQSNFSVMQKICEAQPKHKILQTLITNNAPGLVLFSSGTTGEPKAAVHDLRPMLDKYKKSGKALRAIAFLLFDHIGGFNTVLYNIANGGLLVTPAKRTPEEIATAVQKHKIELLPTSPSFINMMLFSRIYEKYDLSSLKIISYGTEPMPESTLKKLHSVLPNVRLKQTYGLSEVGIMRTKSEADDSLWLKLGGDDEHQIKVVDGILFIKSKMSMLGYLNAPSPFDEDGWMNTTDRVEQKGEYIRIFGRQSELINVGGEKVFPQEIESVLLEVDGVKDAAVGKEANPVLGNVVVCRIATEENTDTDDLKKRLQKHCAEKLEKFKRPVKYKFEHEAFNSERFKRKR